MTFIPGSVAVAKYFDKKRNIALGIASSGGGVGTFLFPPIINLLRHEFGWRGMFLFMSGIALNIVVFASLYRPVVCRWLAKDDDKMEQRKELIVEIEKQKKSQPSHISKLFKNFHFHILSFSNFLFGFGASMIFGHLSAYAQEEMGIRDDLSSFLYSFIGITVTITKFAQGFIISNTKYRICDPYFIYIASLVVSGISTWIILVKDFGYAGLVIYAVIFGIGFAASGGSIIPVILINMAGMDALAISYGLIVFYQASGYLIGSPVAGEYT